MDTFHMLDVACKGAGKHIESSVTEQRPLQPIRKIVIKGSVDVVFKRHDQRMLAVSGETAEAVASVKTYYKGDKLVIEREGVAISFNNGRVAFYGSVGQVIMGNIVNGQPVGQCLSFSQARVVVGISMPEAPAVKVKGSGEMNMLDLRQDELDIEIEGSGDVIACGQVAYLNAQITGSGRVDAGELDTDRASLSITGSGDMEAFVHAEVKARVTGSGSIVVRGNPLRRNDNVAGSGKIKFR